MGCIWAKIIHIVLKHIAPILQSWKLLWQLPCCPAALMALLGMLTFTSK